MVFFIFALYGSWEAGNSLKKRSKGVGTFSTTASVILRTLIFRHFLDPQSPMAKCDPLCTKQVALSPNRSHYSLNLGPEASEESGKWSPRRKVRPALHKAGRNFQLEMKSATRFAEGK